jgi:hypothetical protein
MKLNIKSIALSLLTIFLATTIVVVAVKAITGGLLTPPSNAFDQSGTPQGTMHTLDDIYQAIPSTTITWQTGQSLFLCWNASASNQSISCSAGNGLLDPTGTGAPLMGATEYCNYLEADGSTIAETPQNIWRLPTIGELLQGLNQGFMINTDGGGFYNGYGYWSSTPNASSPGSAWLASDWSGYVVSYGSYGYSGVQVRCVR